MAAHDGFTLADTVTFEHRHNDANGENNRDGHSENFSWNHGVEGHSDDPAVIAARGADLKALLGTLFASTGTVMLTAGDEFGRTQQGNNNAYCQDNEIGWVDWSARDTDLEVFVRGLAATRAEGPVSYANFPKAARWLSREAGDMGVADWESPGAGYLRCEVHTNTAMWGFTIDRDASIAAIKR
ncbi:hypothetical protein [Novosphingobium sp. Rr 2-17]|uniref:hypothetical protein n=1 Tax=Novosphingobium sp. Rr 2-17 TaxID=555793 RepID=UPI00178C6028|nr:hypothetical protein [Novosphingobium sp. Rr 2-17]